MRALFVQSWVVIVLAGAVVGCDDGGGGRPGGRRDAGGGGGGGETGAQCSDGLDNDSDGVLDCDESSCAGTATCAHDSGPRPDTGFGECDTVDFAAETALAPVDIVWIIDNSGSMDEETGLIQMNLNRFVGSLVTSGIEDYRVVVITRPAAFGLMVPPPLGTDTARFKLVDYDVQSSDALSDLIASFSLWSDFIRPDSVLHVIHVTDDASGMDWTTFRGMFMSAIGGRTFTSHAIVSPPGSRHCDVPFGCGFIPESDGCQGDYGAAAGNGDDYWELAAATGGLQMSICSPDWSTVFDRLETTIAVPMPIPCEFRIPEPPEGMTFDRGRVNVLYTPGSGGSAETFPYVGQPDGSVLCPASGHGWYYDDASAPTQIILCPSTCDLVDGDAAGTVNIALGCETIFG